MIIIKEQISIGKKYFGNDILFWSIYLFIKSILYLVPQKKSIQYLKSINYKFKKQDKLYRQRSYNCLRKVRLEDYEFKENMMIKQMVKSYTIGKLIRKIKNSRKIKLNKSLTNTNNIKEKQ